MLTKSEVESRSCFYYFLIAFLSVVWVVHTSAFLSICASDVLIMTVVEVMWLISILSCKFYKQFRNNTPPMAEPLDVPLAVPARSISGTVQVVQAREADVAESV